MEVYQNAGASLGLACGIQGALSLLLLIAAGFHDDFEQGVLTNVNVGGELLGFVRHGYVICQLSEVKTCSKRMFCEVGGILDTRQRRGSVARTSMRVNRKKIASNIHRNVALLL